MEEILQIIYYLKNKDYVSARQFASFLDISTKTLNKKIDEINSVLDPDVVYIDFQKNKGFRLLVKDEDRLSEYISQSVHTRFKKIPNSHRERLSYCLDRLIKSTDYIKRSDLAEELFISEKMVSAILSELEEILNRYDLQIRRRPASGIKVEGNDFSRRMCIISNLIEPYDLLYKADFEKRFEQIVFSISRKHDVQFPEIIQMNLLHYIGVAINEIARGHLLTERIPYDVPEEALSISDAIFKALKEEGFISEYNEAEIEHLALFIVSDRIENKNMRYNQDIPLYLKEIRDEYFFTVDKFFGIDMSRNEQVSSLFLKHLATLDMRLRYKIPVETLIPQHYKQEHPYPYLISSSCAFIIERYYRHKLDNREIYLLSLFILLCYDDVRKQLNRQKLLLICPSDMITSLVLKNYLLNDFGDHIESIDMKDIYDLKDTDLNSYDLVLSSTKIEDDLPVPVTYITENTGRTKIRKQLLRLPYEKALSSFLNEGDFFTGPFKKREEIVSCLIEHLGCREEVSMTEFVSDNLVILNTNQKDLPSKAVICSLKDAVIWDDSKVDLVIMVNVRDPHDKDFFRMMEILSGFASDDDRKEKAVHCTYEQLVRLLSDI